MVVKPMDNPWPTKECFLCGPEAQGGVHVCFSYDDEAHQVISDYVPERRFVGQGDILHGAIQFGLLDEAMGWIIHAEIGQSAVTTSLTVDFHKPAYVRGTPLRITARITQQHGSKIWLEADLTDSDGVLCTSAHGTFHAVKDEKYQELVTAK